MSQYTRERVARQVRQVRQHAINDQDFCFGKLLPAETVEESLKRNKVKFRDCLYTPLVTLWTFLYQVLCPDQSCRAAVARLLALLSLGGGDTAASAKTDPYCKARTKLTEPLVSGLAKDAGAEVHQKTPPTGLLCGRPIKLADGTTSSMPDTPANQKAYPQPPNQKVGLGFPLLRWVGLISLSCGAILDVAMGPYAGKQTGETALLRQLLAGLRPGDVLVVDAIFANYWMIGLLLARGVDVVTHHDGRRKVDFRTGQRVGRHDHLVTWSKPAKAPAWMDQQVYLSLPETLTLRELRVQVQPRGFRVKHLVLLSTLTDAALYPAEELAAAYRLRWYAEVDLRSIKCVMHMDVLRCKSPSMVRKEIWMHLLAYNLVRKLMAEAASAAGIRPRQISFTGTLQTMVAFAAAGWCCPPDIRQGLYQQMLRAVATHRVGDRPDRVEPRAVKRRPKKQTYLTEPRAKATARLLKRT
jgi:hypothetical protein